MRVGIDATVAAQPQIAGIGRFIRSLVGALAETDADHEFTLFYRLRGLRHARHIWKPRDRRFRVRLLADALDRFTLGKLDVFHATYPRLPAHPGATPILSTVHDIYLASRPQMTDASTSQRWAARYRDAVQRARLVMTVSEFSKREMVEFLHADPERIRVVAEAAAPSFRPAPAAEIAAARRRHRLERPYVLFVGGFDRRKNLLGALRAFAIAAGDLPADLTLAVSGAGQGDEETRLVAEALTPRLHFLGHVPEADLPALMSGCEVFLFPSLFEGFGLPAVEAMACNAAVISSSTTALPEVCGDAALLVDPADPEAMAAALVRACTDADLRQRLRHLAAEQAKRFSWDRTARQTLELYGEVARNVLVSATASTGARRTALSSSS